MFAVAHGLGNELGGIPLCFLAGFAHASPGIVIALYAQLNRTVAFIPAVGNPDAGGSLVLQARRREQNRPQLISPHTPRYRPRATDMHTERSTVDAPMPCLGSPHPRDQARGH